MHHDKSISDIYIVMFGKIYHPASQLEGKDSNISGQWKIRCSSFSISAKSTPANQFEQGHE